MASASPPPRQPTLHCFTPPVPPGDEGGCCQGGSSGCGGAEGGGQRLGGVAEDGQGAGLGGQRHQLAEAVEAGAAANGGGLRTENTYLLKP